MQNDIKMLNQKIIYLKNDRALATMALDMFPFRLELLSSLKGLIFYGGENLLTTARPLARAAFYAQETNAKARRANHKARRNTSWKKAK